MTATAVPAAARLRAIAFAAVFYLGSALIALSVGLVVWLLLPGTSLALARWWNRAMLAAARLILGLHVEVTGMAHLPPGGAALIASQHRSAFDTMIWFLLVPAPAYVMKQELFRIPVFGPVARAAGMIGVDRAGGGRAMRAMLAGVRAAIAAGRQVIIFPEGTRVPRGRRVRPQPGIVALAATTGLPVIPVATDSGLLWGRGAFAKRPGTIRVAIGPPIPPGLRREVLLDRLEAAWSALEAEIAPAGGALSPAA
jgi:1-acyl-sn-glycerol-3-phosphate acyltransferase